MDLLQQLQQIPGPSGDEGDIANFVEGWCGQVKGAMVRRIGDLLLVTKGKPQVAIFAHMDTVGFTQGYTHDLIPIGGPHPKGGERMREVRGDGLARLEPVHCDDGKLSWRLSKKRGEPGSRWVYAAPLKIKDDRIRGPYLDNRAGVWNAMRLVERCTDVAVVFTVAEEHTGRGARIGARLVYEELQITRALISDITWHTKHVKIGKGPAISFRDRYMARQRFLDEVVAAAEASGLPFQCEVESAGGSDGSAIELSPYPIDWVFVGAPQKRPHTTREECRVSDLHGMVDLYAYLVPALSK